MIIIRSRYRLWWQISFELRSSLCIRLHDKPSSSTSSVTLDSLLLTAESCCSWLSTERGSRLMSPLPDTSSTRSEFWNTTLQMQHIIHYHCTVEGRWLPWSIVNHTIVTDHTIWQPGFDLLSHIFSVESFRTRQIEIPVLQICRQWALPTQLTVKMDDSRPWTTQSTRAC